jgi:hypothetical protein
MEDASSILKGIGVGALTGVCVGVVGFYLVKPGTGMGVVMFGVVPFLAGFSIALVTHQPSTDRAAMLLAVIASLAILVATGQEGPLCAVLAFPLLIAGLVLGAGAGRFLRRRVIERLRHQAGTTALLLAITIVVAPAAHRAEQHSLEDVRRESISNSVLIHAPADEVWADIQSIDAINVSKPWLMYIGLPVPLRCTLDGRGIGARRTCYFNSGFIQETITEWSPPFRMGLSIDRSNMPGRHWLGFESAAYELQPQGDATKLTRTTTITSRLRPIWYWRYFERLGVASEHEYILNDVARRFTQ